MKKKLSILLALILVLGLVFAACGSKEETPSSNDQPSNQPSGQSNNDKPEEPVKDTMIVAFPQDASSFDPVQYTGNGADSTVFKQLFDNLVIVNRDGSLEGRLAESWTVNEDSTEFVFKLKEGVKFSNGDDFTAKDVVYTFNTLKNVPFFAAYFAYVESVEATGDHEVTVKMSAPDATLLYNLDMIPILGEKSHSTATDFSSNPIGTGPYILDHYTPASEIVFNANENYFRGVARIKKVTMKIIVDPNTSLISLQAGDADICSISASNYENAAGDDNLAIYPGDMQTTYVTILNTTVAPFNDVRVRQAISYALDREFMVDACEAGLGEPAYALISSYGACYGDGVVCDYSYNVNKAKQLLAEAGITTPITIGDIQTIEGWKTRAVAIQGCLKDIGIECGVEVLEAAKLIDNFISGSFEIGTVNFYLASVDPSGLEHFFTTANIGGMNFARYSNPEVDELFEKGKSEGDPTKRMELYTKAYKILCEEVPYVPEYYPAAFYAQDKDLKLDENCRNMINFYNYYWTK